MLGRKGRKTKISRKAVREEKFPLKSWGREKKGNEICDSAWPNLKKKDSGHFERGEKEQHQGMGDPRRKPSRVNHRETVHGC